MNNSITKILEKSHYQTFDLIEGDKRDSDSKKRFELSRLSSYDLEGKTCLDVGSNAGYFLFKLMDKKPKLLIGIELGQKFVQISNDLNQEVYRSPIIKFILGDFFTQEFDTKFDFVICFSTYHYFGDDQEVFFDKCHEIMNDDTILLLEIEEYPLNDSPAVDVDERDPNRLYPNNLKLQEYIRGKFVILDKYISVNQRGSVHDRWFYKLGKVNVSSPPSADKRPLVGDYKKTIIVLTGVSNIGKSTMSELLLNNKLNYVSIDAACLLADIDEVRNYIKKVEESGKNINYNAGELFHFVKESCPDKFIEYFFNKYIKENENLNIFVEGYVFIFTEMYQLFIDKCKEADYRIWNINRIL